ncbi:MAG: aldehyde dehydrogenase family protein, partial [Nitrospinota bacterium]|nr:aldehyde dehydrogenase family protein [Nitrospinota bacterium]
MTEVISSFNPNTQDVVGAVPITPIESISDILQKSVSAQKKWQQLRVKERAEILKQVRKQLVKNSDELVSLISEETGKPFWDSFIEVMTAVEHLKYMCNHAPLILSQEKRSPGIFIHKRTYIRYFPHGTAGIISPWNYPLILTASPVVEALLSGNTVVLKPSELTPLTGNKIRQIFIDGGIPKEVFQIVHGFGDIGAAIVESPMIDIICFTGSVKVGRAIAEACGKQLKPSILELGGSDPMIILEDADLDRS